jgi:hypothetical protein
VATGSLIQYCRYLKSKQFAGFWAPTIKNPNQLQSFIQRPLQIGAMKSYWEQSINYLDGREHHLKLKLLDKKNPISGSNSRVPGLRLQWSGPSKSMSSLVLIKVKRMSGCT